MANTFRVGTYNVENLYDRFDDPYSTGDDPWGWFRSSPKPSYKLYEIAERIRCSGVDILGVQEVENFGALRNFVQASVGPKFTPNQGIVSLQSNDPRGIDLGLLSSLPLGRVISHRFNQFTSPKGKKLRFSRDCLQVEIFDKGRTDILVTVFLCHFKSKYSKYDERSEPKKYKEDQEKSADKRQGEAEEVARIIRKNLDISKDLFIVLGDFDDTSDSKALAPLIGDGNGLGLKDSTSLIQQDDQSAESTRRRGRDTHRWERTDKATGKLKRTWSQIDYILVSPALWKLKTSRVGVMNNPIGKGSDHFLSWIEFKAPKGLQV